jgi:O-methyltransferase involved in polyketide biosynthesis
MSTFNKQSSHTADGLVYIRSLTDIPFAKEIWATLQKSGGISSDDMERATRGTFMYPFMEARYLMTDLEIAKSGTDQILELASGLSPRGITMTASPTVTYVEFDLPDKLEEKKKIIDQLVAEGKITSRNNLYLDSGNVTDTANFERAARHFANRPVAVICEGLLRYISPTDRKALADNIHMLLKKHGGIWTTPDVEFFDPLKTPEEEKKRLEERFEKFGYDVRPNLFKDADDAEMFFRECGFDVAKYPAINMMDKLVLPERMGLKKEDVIRCLTNRFCFTMTVAA